MVECCVWDAEVPGSRPGTPTKYVKKRTHTVITIDAIMCSVKKKEKKLSAIKLRENGNSYSLISQKLNIPKSTLSDWLKKIPFSPNEKTLRRIKTAPIKSANTIHRKKALSIKKAKSLAIREVGILSKRDLFMFGVGLYLGEGSKSIETVRIINSDPSVINIGIKWLKNSCGVNIENLKITLHVYPDTDIDAAIKYWSRITKIPITQFYKTQIDVRKGKSLKLKGKLPYGTAQLRVLASGKQQNGVFLHRRILGWIEAVSKQVNMQD